MIERLHKETKKLTKKPKGRKRKLDFTETD
jgi:hypothetical protein